MSDPEPPRPLKGACVPVNEEENLMQKLAIQPATTTPLMEMPDQSAEALELAHRLAAEVRAELAALEQESTLDEYMAQRRDRVFTR